LSIQEVKADCADQGGIAMDGPLEKLRRDTQMLGGELHTEHALDVRRGSPDGAKPARWMPGDGLISEWDGSDPREGLTGDQRALVRRLARGESIEDAATRVGMHPKRAGRSLRIPRVQRALRIEIARPMSGAELRGDWKKEAQ
jgi:hypothetical protein